MTARPQFSQVEQMRTAGASGTVPVSNGSGVLSMSAPMPAAHAASHVGAGSDPITSLGAHAVTGDLEFSATALLKWGTTSSFPALKRNITAPSSCLEARFADDSDSCYFRAQHIGVNTDPSAGHLILGNEIFATSGNVVGMGIFPASTPSAVVANNLYGVQGNVFFGSANWGAGSNVNALQFYPAPDYQYGSTSWGSSNLNLLGVTTGGMINIFGRTVTCNDLVGIQVGSLTHIFGAPGAVSASRSAGVVVLTPSASTGTIARQTGIEIEDQGSAGTVVQGMWLHGDGAGSDVCLGAGVANNPDARVFYDGSNLIVDPDNLGSGIVLIGATGDDDLKLNAIEVDGALNHDGSTVGFYGTTPAAQSAAYTRNATIVASRTLLASASATVTNNNNVLAALIADLQAVGLLA